MPGKIVLLLVVFAIVSPSHVMADCTQEQKAAILYDCRKYLSRMARRIVAPKTWDHCCRDVRAVPNRDMDCIRKLLTYTEVMRIVEIRITNLAYLC
uniref:Bifunctional inhibitor/plant lipid transfer protein/seed storage helical domain-containing protein n=1 Tax=Setaria italica TaxID=4555 RepID=K3YKG1_SETIT